MATLANRFVALTLLLVIIVAISGCQTTQPVPVRTSPATTDTNPGETTSTSQPSSTSNSASPNDSTTTSTQPTTPATASGPTTHKVTIREYKFYPSTITIRVGDTIHWDQFDNIRHNIDVFSGPETFSSPLMSYSHNYEHTFTKPGTYNYVCDPHPYMKGTIIVE